MSQLSELLSGFIENYPIVKGVKLQSLQWPLDESMGTNLDAIDAYKDVIISSVDEGFQPQFSFIITETGSVIVFFLDEVNYLCVYTDDTLPNKQLAQKMYDEYKTKFLASISALFQ